MSSRRKQRAYLSKPRPNTHISDEGGVVAGGGGAALTRRINSFVFAQVLAGNKVETDEVARLVANVRRHREVTDEDAQTARDALASLSRRHATIRESIVIREDSCE